MLISGAGFAQVNIPDTNFRNLLLNSNATTNLVALDENEEYIAVDANGNGAIEAAEALAVHFLNIDGENIGSLTGIEHFTNLTYLNAMQNNLSVVNLSALVNLETLRLGSCGITSLNVAGLTKLEGMDLYGNNLTTLDVSTLVNLEILDTYENFNLSAINFGEIYKIKVLLIGNNPITMLDTSNFSLLTQFECSDTKVTSLDLSNNPTINYMVITANADLQTINLKNNTAVTYFLTANPNLVSVCADASRVTELEEYFEAQEQDVAVSTECNNAPIGINIPDDHFREKLLFSDGVENLVAMNEENEFIAVDANENGVIEHEEALAVYRLGLTAAQIESLEGIEHFTNLITLKADYNSLTAVDLTALTELQALWLSNNDLTAVNIDGLDKLSILDLSDNNLTFVDASSLTGLLDLNVSGNANLTALDFGDIAKIEELKIAGNPITSLDLSNLTLLGRLRCSDTKLTTIDLSNNPEIIDFEITDNEELESINLKNNTSEIYFITDNTNLESVCADEDRITEFEDYFEELEQDVEANTCTLGGGDVAANSFVMYPNPSSDSINFEGDSVIEFVEVYTTDGRMVEKKAVNAANATIDISALPSAAYLVKVKTEKGFESVRLIKQ